MPTRQSRNSCALHPTSPHLQVVGQAVCVGKVEQGAEDGGAHVLDVDAALVPLLHGARQQGAEHGRACLCRGGWLVAGEHNWQQGRITV